MITNNPKYILPGSEVYYKEYSTMFVYPGEDGFKNPNYFIDNRGRCFSKAWLGPSAFLKDETSIVPALLLKIQNHRVVLAEEVIKLYYYNNTIY
jgi:hypothetical protein